MQVQTGIVKYKDRTDIMCSYGITEDGTQYYFLDGGELSNGNRIVSNALVEAVDPLVKASNVGVIDGDGRVVIPLQNKSIKSIAEGILLVEKAVPTTESVIEAANSKKDPLAAAKLVTSAASIKEKMNAIMGPEGRFVFNDQFSEASIFDYNGNNLVDDEYYSFVGMVMDKIYFSKNVVDSEIREYSMLPKDVRSNEVDGNTVDVTNVDGEAIQQVINQEMQQQENQINGEVANTGNTTEAVNNNNNEGAGVPLANVSEDVSNGLLVDNNINNNEGVVPNIPIANEANGNGAEEGVPLTDMNQVTDGVNDIANPVADNNMINPTEVSDVTSEMPVVNADNNIENNTEGVQSMNMGAPDSTNDMANPVADNNMVNPTEVSDVTSEMPAVNADNNTEGVPLTDMNQVNDMFNPAADNNMINPAEVSDVTSEMPVVNPDDNTKEVQSTNMEATDNTNDMFNPAVDNNVVNPTEVSDVTSEMPVVNPDNNTEEVQPTNMEATDNINDMFNPTADNMISPTEVSNVTGEMPVVNADNDAPLTNVDTAIDANNFVPPVDNNINNSVADNVEESPMNLNFASGKDEDIPMPVVEPDKEDSQDVKEEEEVEDSPINSIVDQYKISDEVEEDEEVENKEVEEPEEEEDYEPFERKVVDTKRRSSRKARSYEKPKKRQIREEEEDDYKYPYEEERKYTRDDDDMNIFGDSILKEDKIFGLDDDFRDRDSFRDEREERRFSDYDAYERVNRDDDKYDHRLNEDSLDDVADTMSRLIALNRDQRGQINDYEKQINNYEERLEKASEAYNTVTEKAKEQIDGLNDKVAQSNRQIDELNSKVGNFERIVKKLEDRNTALDDKIRDDSQIIEDQKREIDYLKRQLAGKEKVVGLLKEARDVFRDPHSSYDDSYSYNYNKDSSYKRRAA